MEVLITRLLRARPMKVGVLSHADMEQPEILNPLHHGKPKLYSTV